MKKTIAEKLAKKQREISVSEFFSKNRHLLGFDNPHKSILTTVREGVDNSLDACEEARILPEIYVGVFEVDEGRYLICIEDNGPGIVKKQVPMVFGKLLYGSKFHRLKQERGSQGIGISAAVMYGQITTGCSTYVTTKINKNSDIYRFEIQIDMKKNEPVIISETKVIDQHWLDKDSGILVEIELKASFKTGQHSVESYLRQTALANPHASIYYVSNRGNSFSLKRIVNKLPFQSSEIKPHPHGIEFGVFKRLLEEYQPKKINKFLTSTFSRVTSQTVNKIINKIGRIDTKYYKENPQILYDGLKSTKIKAPPTNCLSPIGADLIQKALLNLVHINNGKILSQDNINKIIKSSIKYRNGLDYNGLFLVSITRKPFVYRGNPFVIEVGIAYGKGIQADEPVKLYRFANKVPLLYQQGACAINKAMMQTVWKNYGIQQSRGAFPTGPMIVLVHISSVWVPYTSESKEAIAHYNEIIKEIKLALQDVGRKLHLYIKRQRRFADEEKKKKYICKYIPYIAEALDELLDLGKNDTKNVEINLKNILERQRNKS
jgi:DNA topoisomerase-6 subunit B